MPNLGSENANRGEKVRKLTRAAEMLMARVGVTDFAAPGLVELIAEWDATMWATVASVAGISTCSGAAKGERVCGKCIALVVADFRERPALAMALQRMGY